ncbi:hypothetical protein Syun_029112 [Stephania yunnanensis]|uniref:Pentatricopeptide repeat-containing protein n=1 Tax=Stephania yunnanensis TaxID=152371 RepID=A0AAP0E804_9MAGN
MTVEQNRANSLSMCPLLLLLRTSTNLHQIHQIHAQIILHNLPIQSHLLSKLADLRRLDYAQSIFNQITSPTDHSWNSIIKCHSLCIHSSQNSLLFYTKMLTTHVRPTNLTYPFVFKACSTRSVIVEGEQVHAHVAKLGFSTDIFVGNSMIDMYCKSAKMGSALLVFDEMTERDEVSWNSVVSGHVFVGEIVEARRVFAEMPVRRNAVCWTALINGYGKEGKLVEMMGVFLQMLVSADDAAPNSATMVCLLSACSSVANLELGRWVSVFIDVNGMPSNMIMSTALVDMYSKCGEVEKARRLFDGIGSKNLVCWNAMITGYVQQGLLVEAIKLFHLLRDDSLTPNEITLVNVLSACAGLGALELGREVRLYLGRNRLDLNEILAAALVDMYSKCGRIDDACLVFVKTRTKDSALWNVMIQSLAQHSRGKDALAVLSQMEASGAKPNDITFIGVLSACNHSRLIEEGRIQFSNMVVKYSLSPKIEHYACMVDLLGRAGYLVEAVELIRNMAVPPDSIIWCSLLSACSIHRNADLADKIGELVLSNEDPDLGSFISLCNVYRSVGRWSDVARMKQLVMEKGLKKPAGCSWIELQRRRCS